MKRKFALLLTLTLSTALFCGCGSNSSSNSSSAEKTVSPTSGTAVSSSEPARSPDQEKADEAAKLIDAIYVQERTDKTDEQCKAAKEAWDALTDAQKELVEGEYADPDYFGKDTGDASKDDPRNADDIGENELLVVSFGTSFNDSRAEDIGGIEKALEDAFPDWSVRRAFTSQIIINHIQARDGEHIDNMEQALQRAVDNQVKHLVIQPTHLMHGAEYEEIIAAVDARRSSFESIAIAEPLLGKTGKDSSELNLDKQITANAAVAAAVKEAGFGSLEKAVRDGTAFVFMGHGTSHSAKVTYSQMQSMVGELGLTNVFIGTVEGEPEETACETVIEAVHAAGFKKVVLRPLMVVAGDHANNDMAGDDEDSWKSMFKASGYFDKIDCQVRGLGGIETIQKLYVAHTQAATGVPEAEIFGKLFPEVEYTPSDLHVDLTSSENAGSESESVLDDGLYTADFRTDSSMFHVNEANNGKGTLTVKDGKMTIHISLVSKKILNLYPGLAQDAVKEGAVLLQPTTDTVTYSDGSTEEVYGFDVPVPALNAEFDLAVVGTSGKWYDHKVRAFNPRVFETDELVDGIYRVNVRLSGGSGKATVKSPAKLTVKDGEMSATIVWSSSNYDYMIVDGKKILPLTTEGGSAFIVPVAALDEELPVAADTVAMSEPHEIEYTLFFDSASIMP